MSKKKAPALHERRGREDISTRPPRLAGYPIKLAGDARLHRLSLAADSCVNRKYYGGDPGGWLFYTSDAAGERARGDFWGRPRLLKKTTKTTMVVSYYQIVRKYEQFTS